MTPGFAATALGLAERTFPVLAPVAVEDRAPLARPPALPNVPRRSRASRGVDQFGLALSLGAIAFGMAVLFRGRRQ